MCLKGMDAKAVPAAVKWMFLGNAPPGTQSVESGFEGCPVDHDYHRLSAQRGVSDSHEIGCAS